MKSLNVIIEHMDDTLEEAHDYFRDYIIYKDDVPSLATTALEMAKTHLELYCKWHNVATTIIDNYKKIKGEAPEYMKSLWNFKHEKLMEEYHELKYKIMNA